MPSGWITSDRRAELPADWSARRAEALRLNPERICHVCRLPGGDELDHVNGDRIDHRQSNLAWVHGHRAVKAGHSKVNCHAAKTRAERPSLNRPKPPHPAL